MLRHSVLLVLCLCLLAPTPTASADDADKPSAKKSPLDGAWKIESARRDGQEFDRPVGDRIHFAADKMSIDIKSQDEKIEITIKTDTTKSPHHIDMTVNRNGTLQTVQAVFEVKGDTLRLCMPRPDGDRPESLESQGSDTVSIVAKRVKDEKSDS